MKFKNFSLCLTIACCFGMLVQGTAHCQKNQTTSSGKFVVKEITEPIAAPTSSAPINGANYTIVPGLGTLNPITGEDTGFFFGVAADPNTGEVNLGVMDGAEETIAGDFAEVFGFAAPNAVNSYECIENLGVDPNGSGRFLIRVTLGVYATGTETQWDSLTLDLQDPLDADLDGITGKGPDGVYGTDDDVDAPDGFFDTGDGELDAVFPLDVVGLVFLIDLDGDGDPNNDPPTPATRTGLFIGSNAGGTDVSFDPGTGIRTVTRADWQMLDVNGDLADIDGDDVPDGPFDLSGFGVFNDPFAGWTGALGVGFGTAGNVCSTIETLNGKVRANELIVEYLSDVEAKEGCFDPFADMGCDNELGDVNGDGIISLLDVAPFVDAILTNTFVCEADINMDGVVDLLDVAPFVDLIIG